MTNGVLKGVVSAMVVALVSPAAETWAGSKNRHGKGQVHHRVVAPANCAANQNCDAGNPRGYQPAAGCGQQWPPVEDAQPIRQIPMPMPWRNGIGGNGMGPNGMGGNGIGGNGIQGANVVNDLPVEVREAIRDAANSGKSATPTDVWPGSGGTTSTTDEGRSYRAQEMFEFLAAQTRELEWQLFSVRRWSPVDQQQFREVYGADPSARLWFARAVSAQIARNRQAMVALGHGALPAED